MTGQQLIDGLQATGTGERHLRAAVAYLVEHPRAGGAEVLHVMAAAGLNEVTTAKARKLLGNEAPAERVYDLPPFPVRAPVGGATVQGKHYAAGEPIPGPVLDAATADELQSLRTDLPPKRKRGEPAVEPDAPAADTPPHTDTTESTPAADASESPAPASAPHNVKDKLAGLRSKKS